MLRNSMHALTLGLLVFAMVQGMATTRAAEQARQETVVLDVKNMTCAVCPITVRKALEKVPGVARAEVEYEGDGLGWAKVTFDPAKTSTEALTSATTRAGYPSTVK